MKTSSVLFFALTVLGAARTVRAGEPTKQACLDAFVTGQKQQRAGDLLAARSSFLLCARDPCPKTLQPDCTSAEDAVERRTPSLSLRIIRDAARTTPLALRVDGVDRTDMAGGRAVRFNPGPHKLVLIEEGAAPVQQEVVLAEDEGARVTTFDLRLRPPLAEAKQAPKSERRNLGWIIASASLGVLGVGGFTTFGLIGKSAYDDLGACKPHCRREDGDAAKRDFLVADVSLGIGITGLAVAGILLLTQPSHPAIAPVRTAKDH